MCKSLYFAMVEVDVYMDEFVGGFGKKYLHLRDFQCAR
jgi:hypothetical protein